MSELYECLAKGDMKGFCAALDTASIDDLKGVLVTSAECGNLDIVKLLTQRGIYDSWAIVSASSHGRLDVIRYLLQHGAGNRKAALIGAAAHGKLEAVKLLMQDGFSDTNEALADAAMRGYLDIVVFLTEHGGDITAPVYNSETAVSLAWKHGHKDVCAYFDKVLKG